MKSKKITARLLALVLAVCLLAGLGLSASAAEANQAVVDAKQAVVQIQLWFSDPEHLVNELYLSYGTGFLINENTVVTNEHVINAKTNSEVAYQWAEYLYQNTGLVYTPADIMEHMELHIMVLRDVYVEATVRKVSTEYDYAILTLNEPIYNRTTLALRSSSSLTQTETVYALGFPSDIEDLTDQSNLTADNVTITTGNVNKVDRFSFGSYEVGPNGYNIRYYENVDCVESSAKIASGNSGGPLVDSNGAVVGINVAGDDNRNLAIASDQLIAALDALGIPYTSADAPVVEPTTEPTEPSTTEAPTTQATEAPTTKATEAEDEDEDKVSNDEDEDDEKDVKKSDEGLSTTTLILIVAAAAVVIIVVVVIVVLGSGKKKSASAQAAPANARPAAPSPANTAGFAPTPTYPLQGAGETTVLNQGAGETTVLAHNVNGGTLTRKRTGETVPVNAETFIIGRERKGVNYCISDNSSISRNHVKLTVRGGITYLSDLGAANGTFVNGVKVMPRQEVALKSGDKITLADEDLEYRN